jgi:hypothetical protein
MTVKQLIRSLNSLQQDKNIEVECPNGLLVDPDIKYFRQNPFDGDKFALKYIITYSGR